MTDAEPKPASPAARIPLTEIVASKTNPRTSFTAPDIAELAVERLYRQNYQVAA